MSDEAQVVRSAIPQISAASLRVIDLFRSTEIGEVVTYETVSAAAGFDVRERRYVVATAKRRVLTDDGIHMATVRGVGYKRLSAKEAADTIGSDLTRSRNAARSGTRKAQRISVLELPEAQRSRFVAQATLCALISESTKARSQDRLAAVAETRPEDTAILAQREALDALKRGE